MGRVKNWEVKEGKKQGGGLLGMHHIHIHMEAAVKSRLFSGNNKK